MWRLLTLPFTTHQSKPPLSSICYTRFYPLWRCHTGQRYAANTLSRSGGRQACPILARDWSFGFRRPCSPPNPTINETLVLMTPSYSTWAPSVKRMPQNDPMQVPRQALVHQYGEKCSKRYPHRVLCPGEQKHASPGISARVVARFVHEDQDIDG